jgi:putative fels-1 prophage protease subunit of ATP-dependent protease|nr:MAG TPA: major capsid protein [Caudoviricetes sp.]
MNKKKLRQVKLLRQQEIVDAAKNAGRDLSVEEQAEFDTLQRDIDTLSMEIEAERGQGGNDPTTLPATGENIQRAVEQERERIRSITTLCEEFGMEARSYIESGVTLETVREAVIEHMRTNGKPVPSRGVNVVATAEDKFREAATDALIMRSGMELVKPADGSRQMMGMSLRDLAIECLENEGETGLNRRSSEELYGMLQRQFYNPTAAFPSILDNAINKSYVEGHKTVAVTFDRWTKKGSLKDFKTADNNYLAGPAGEFLEVPEGGEIKHDTFKDEKRPTRKIRTYGRQFTLTRQAFINDDIDLVTRIPAKYAASARKTINKKVYTILFENSAIYDGTALFSAAHKNLLATGTGITREAMQKMIIALQSQTDEFGEAIIVRPATLIVPSGMGFEVFTIFNSPTINTAGNTQAVNPLFRYSSSIEIVEEPTINVLSGGYGNAMPWFLVGHKDDTDFIEVDYLNGQEIPTIRRMETPGTLGFVWDIYLDFGISVMDWRGAVKNNGIVVADPLN